MEMQGPTHSVPLLSRGLLNKEEMQGADSIVVREMTVNVEKEILSNHTPTEKVINIVEGCKVKPEGLRIENLPVVDIMYSLFQIRAHSLDKEYNYPCTCPYCEFQFMFPVLIPDDFGLRFAEDDIVEPVVLEPLPSGMVLSVRYLRGHDLLNIERKSSMLLKAKAQRGGFRKGKGPKGLDVNMRNLQYAERLSRQIVSVNGEEVVGPQAKAYVDHMSLKDINAYKNMLECLDFGMDTEIEIICPSCSVADYHLIQLRPDFFRPNRTRKEGPDPN